MMSARYDWICRRIEAYGRMAVEVLGGAPERPLVEFEDEDPDGALIQDNLLNAMEKSMLREDEAGSLSPPTEPEAEPEPDEGVGEES